MRVILSGGGTGGHIYPAVAVAERLRERGVEVLFVGAEGKMEMEKVPALGYDIEGLPVAGIQRRLSLKNLALPAKIWRSVRRARRIIKRFRTDVVVGFGGYASAPVLWAAQMMGIPTVIQEQNSYAGLTNKILGRRARKVCVAYDGMERFFRAKSIVHTGNPLRGSFGAGASHKEALDYFGFTEDRPVVLVLGGSLGTRTLNEMMKRRIAQGLGDIQVIWQTGRFYEKEMDEFMKREAGDQKHTHVWKNAFIERMDLAYAAADVVISRSGAITVSELMLAGKAVVFVPSPNVAEDHQTKNARALVDKGAAVMVRDADAVSDAFAVVEELLADNARRSTLETNIRALATADAAERVVETVMGV
jgi:UDP-N-acetylglucosamine--N-acetylmuramyl-(pentapeptide) pyrophosphoryl-undecaprenol N-acetylglucosamine transferase